MTKNNSTKSLLLTSFKSLLLQHSFDKITIQMIAEDAGVIRSTFYNYFQDKYNLFDWILEEELFQALDKLVDTDMEREAIKMIFSHFDKNQAFYARAFQVKGQNAFEAILKNKILYFFNRISSKHGLKLDKRLPTLSGEIIEKYYTAGIVFILEKWVTENPKISAEEIFEIYEYLISHSILDLASNE